MGEEKKEKNKEDLSSITPIGLLASLFERDLRSFARYDTHAYIDIESDHVGSLTIITSDFEYQFEVHNQTPAQLVAYWSHRRRIPGIPPTGRQILHGGPCAESTWTKIICAIVSRELVARAPQMT